MTKYLIKYSILISSILLLTSSCGTHKTTHGALYDPNEVSSLSKKLGIELNNVNKEDDKNIPLYAEISQWIGTRYQHGGMSRKGVDCSGFTLLIFQRVYNKKLPRSTSELSSMNMPHVSKDNLHTGDLVFFATSKNRNKITHVGIYLKDGYFVHASTSKGVIVSHLSEEYYERAWRKGGRPKE